MRRLLDTNVCIRYWNGKAPAVRLRLRTLPPSEILVCSVVKAELMAGALRSNDPQRSLARQQAFLSVFVSLPFDDVAAGQYAQIRAHLEQERIRRDSQRKPDQMPERADEHLPANYPQKKRHQQAVQADAAAAREAAWSRNIVGV